jgi:hypothetical protein
MGAALSSGWSAGQAAQGASASEVRRRNRELARGSAQAQERRIAAAIAKRERKAARRIKEQQQTH